MGKLFPFLRRTVAHESDVPSHLRDLATEWEGKPPGRGVIVVIVQDEGYPELRGYGDVGTPMVELELGKMQLFKYYLGGRA